MRSFSSVYAILTALACLATLPCHAASKPKDAPPTEKSPITAKPTERVVGPLSPAEAEALATMNDKIKAYIDLHVKIEKTLPVLPKDATPQQIDKNQRDFEALMRQSRAGAKQGDIFTPQATPVIRSLLATIFGGPEGKLLKASIFDENPGPIKLAVNERYPDNVPLSNVPAQVLQTLPKLSEDIEYRFIGDNLILFDSHAHIVADFIPDVMPK